MSAKCRCPDVWFKTALDYLIYNTDWIVAEDFTPERQSGVTLTSVGRHLSVTGGEGRKGEEGRGWKDANHPTLEICVEHFKEHFTPEQIRRAFQSFEADNIEGYWMWGRKRVGDWRAAMETRLKDRIDRNGKPEDETLTKDEILKQSLR